jgi:hypothetical protein
MLFSLWMRARYGMLPGSPQKSVAIGGKIIILETNHFSKTKKHVTSSFERS